MVDPRPSISASEGKVGEKDEDLDLARISDDVDNDEGTGEDAGANVDNAEEGLALEVDENLDAKVGRRRFEDEPVDQIKYN